MSRRKGNHQLTADSLAVAPPVLGRPTLTVGEIADRLHAIAPNKPMTIERIRHWTREGYWCRWISITQGTGKHRRYAEESRYDVAILSVIADIGLPIVSQGYLRSALPLARRALRKWMRAQKQEPGHPIFFHNFASPKRHGRPNSQYSREYGQARSGCRAYDHYQFVADFRSCVERASALTGTAF